MSEFKRSSAFEKPTRRCYMCKRELPTDRFLTITAQSSGGRYKYTTPSFDCRECRNKQKREWRRRKAEAAGKTFSPRGDRAALEARAAARAALRQKEREANRQQREASRESIRRHRAISHSLVCSQCGESKPRDMFWPSCQTTCKSCFDEAQRARRKRDVETLNEQYVRRQLASETGLRRAQMPQVLVEAKRAQMLIRRNVPTMPELLSLWLQRRLHAGPVDAEQLNREARAAGFRPTDSTYRPARRRVASFDAATNTWRKHEHEHRDYEPGDQEASDDDAATRPAARSVR